MHTFMMSLYNEICCHIYRDDQNSAQMSRTCLIGLYNLEIHVFSVIDGNRSSRNSCHWSSVDNQCKSVTGSRFLSGMTNNAGL